MTSDTLFLYDTGRKEKRLFEPLGTTVQMYVCGPTVYDRAHIGNARSVVVFDLLYRLLKEKYGDVRYVRNITDVDDKIIDAARLNGESINTLTERTLNFFHDDMDALFALRPTHEPHATQHIDGMIRIIERLMARNVAYIAGDQVMFHVKHCPDYGRLSGRRLSDQHAGARVDVDPSKRDPLDFVLWKPSAPEEPGWDSPWGRGRPGWHIECSAMSHALLDLPFDIHGGGQDLIFPHHENEQAQSCRAFDVPDLAHFWVHNGILTVGGEKMSKSLGNFVTVSDALKHWPGEVVRWVLLSAHYRQPLDWTKSKLKEAKKNLDYIYGALQKMQPDTKASNVKLSWNTLFAQALLNDLNTPAAFKHLLAQATIVHQDTSAHGPSDTVKTLLSWARFLGFAQQSPQEWFQGQPTEGLSANDIDVLIQKRRDARSRKDFKTADEIRMHLKESGIILEDTGANTTWRRL